MNAMILYFLIIILILFVLLGWVVFKYVQFNGHLLKSKQLVEEATTFSFEPTGASSMRILVAGDSTAVGVGSAKRESIAGRVHGLYPEASIRNIGVSGLRVAGLIPILKQVQSERFDVIILQIGGNDIVRRTRFSDLESNLDEVLDLAHEMGDKVILLTSGNVGSALIFPKVVRLFLTQRTLAVRNIFMKIATANGTTYVDLFQEAKVDPFAINPDKYYAADYFHPNGEGYGIWFEKVKAVLEKKWLIRKKKGQVQFSPFGFGYIIFDLYEKKFLTIDGRGS